MFVVVARGEEAKQFSCPICKELMKREFLDDEEEWVWKNAVKRDDKVRSSYLSRGGSGVDAPPVDLPRHLPRRSCSFDEYTCGAP